jgi:hypothetical protein
VSIPAPLECVVQANDLTEHPITDLGRLRRHRFMLGFLAQAQSEGLV